MSIPSIGLVAYPHLIPFLYSIPHSVFTNSLPEKLFDLFTVTSFGLPLSSGHLQYSLTGIMIYWNIWISLLFPAEFSG